MPAIPIKKQNTNSKFLFLDDLPEFAFKFSQTLKERDIISLTGNIGAGKTTFVFSLMQSLGLSTDQAFSSPTFTILNQYTVSNWLINHVDLYRLNKFEELESLDIFRFFDEPNTLTFIEWGDKFPELKNFYSKKIHFEYVTNKSLERLISYDGFEV